MLELRTSGGTTPDGDPIREIDPTNDANAYRYTCPHGHTSFEPTDGFIWCRYCEQSSQIEDATHDHVRDQKTGESIPWDAIVLRE